MGKPMSATPTPESMVWQGGANTLENRCPTTTAPKGGWGGGDAASPVRREVVCDLVPMPGYLGGRATVGPSTPCEAIYPSLDR